jgi:hypothetical protein
MVTENLWPWVKQRFLRYIKTWCIIISDEFNFKRRTSALKNINRMNKNAMDWEKTFAIIQIKYWAQCLTHRKHLKIYKC